MSDPTPLDWLYRLLLLLASVLGIRLDAMPAARPPDSIWEEPSPRCHLLCWYAGTMGCKSADDCGAWCGDLDAMSACTQPLDAFFACVKSQGRAMRQCDPEAPDRGSALACAAERRAVRECMSAKKAEHTPRSAPSK